MTPDRPRRSYDYQKDQLGLLAVIGVVLLLFLLYRVFVSLGPTEDVEAEMGGLGTLSTSSATTAEVPPGSPGTSDELTAGGVSLLPLSESAGSVGSLAGYAGDPAIGTGVRVLSVPADEGFWVGTSATDRVWVQLIGVGESPYTVLPGDRASFTGQVVTHSPAFASGIGAGDQAGVDLLTAQGAHIEVGMDRLSLNR